MDEMYTMFRKVNGRLVAVCSYPLLFASCDNGGNCDGGGVDHERSEDSGPGLFFFEW